MMSGYGTSSGYQNPGSTPGSGRSMSDFEFQRVAQTVGTNIQKILQHVSSMQRMITQVGTSQDNTQFRQQLHHITHSTGQLAKETAHHIMEMNSASGIGASADQRQWRLQRERLQNDFTKALNSFQATQRTAAQKEKEAMQKAKAHKAALPRLDGKEPQQQNLIDVEEGAGEGGSGIIPPGQSKTQMMLEEEESLKELQEREKSIRQLESDIMDVNTIFKDLATMVHEQSEFVDSIEANVESTHVRVSEGTEQLRQAEHFKNKARKKKFILSIIGIIILIIVIIIIATQFN